MVWLLTTKIDVVKIIQKTYCAKYIHLAQWSLIPKPPQNAGRILDVKRLEKKNVIVFVIDIYSFVNIVGVAV